MYGMNSDVDGNCLDCKKASDVVGEKVKVTCTSKLQDRCGAKPSSSGSSDEGGLGAVAIVFIVLACVAVVVAVCVVLFLFRDKLCHRDVAYQAVRLHE